MLKLPLVRHVISSAGDPVWSGGGVDPNRWKLRYGWKMAFELTYGYFHCIGRTVYSAGFVSSEDDAEKWVHDKQHGKGGKTVVPESDPVRRCPVRHCHMKFQKPWFSYRQTGDGPDAP